MQIIQRRYEWAYTSLSLDHQFVDKEMKQTQPSVFLIILRNIQKSFPQIVKESSYKVRVFELLKINAVKVEALDIIPGILEWEMEVRESGSYMERQT